MKKITIGRGRECDIRISDSTDRISRRQAIITFSPLGKMMIYDTSYNGTFVNGEPVVKPEGKPVKRGDNVNFARLADLDWSLVKNPYRKMWNFIFLILSVLIIAGAGLLVWSLCLVDKGDMGTKETPKEVVSNDSIAPVNDSLKLETPTQTSIKSKKSDTPASRHETKQPKKASEPKQENSKTNEQVISEPNTQTKEVIHSDVYSKDKE